jgi:hypothetical protein
VKNKGPTSFVKVTRNIKATRVESRETPIEFPESGVLYVFNVADWPNRTAFYDKIAFSFGIPSTQKQVYCDYFGAKVMHYERTCQGVYFCPVTESDPKQTCTVKPCRFRFHVCDVHRVALKKSPACKLKLHFYVPMEKEDNRRLMICLGDHNHQNLTMDDLQTPQDSNPIIKVEEEKKMGVVVERNDLKVPIPEKPKMVIPKIELNPPPMTSPRSYLLQKENSPHQTIPIVTPTVVRNISQKPEIPKIGNFTSIHQFQQNFSIAPKISPKNSPHNDREPSPYHLIHSNDLSTNYRDIMVPSPRDHTSSPNFHREHLFSPALQQPYHMRDMNVSPQPRDFLTPSPSLDRLSPWMFDKSPRYYNSVGLPLSGRSSNGSSTENSPREIYDLVNERKRKLPDVIDPVGETGIKDLTLGQKKDEMHEDEHDPEMVNIALPSITSFDDPFPYSEKKKKK